MNSSAERAGHHEIARLPRPKWSPTCCGLGNVTIEWNSGSRPHFVLSDNPGRRRRDCVARLALGYVMPCFQREESDSALGDLIPSCGA